MFETHHGKMLRLLILAAACMGAPAARAALGGSAAGIGADAAQLHGSLQASQGAAFSTVTITTDNGITVREFVDSSGLVFAVNWSGPAVPDLHGLLGEYFANYTQVLSALPNAGRQRAIHVVTAGLVVLSGGHLRAYSGLAYLPVRIPAGVAIEALR